MNHTFHRRFVWIAARFDVNSRLVTTSKMGNCKRAFIFDVYNLKGLFASFKLEVSLIYRSIALRTSKTLFDLPPNLKMKPKLNLMAFESKEICSIQFY